MTKENTKQLKGIAILLMLAHHLFAFPNRIPFGFSFKNYHLFFIIGSFGKICVPIFMFLGGYGLYASSVCIKDNQDIVSCNLLKKIISLYKKYWKVFVIFIPLGLIFFSNQICFSKENLGSSFANANIYKVVSSFLGIENLFNYEWWFLKSYIFSLFLGYIFIEVFKQKRNVYLEFIIVILWYILLSNIFPNLLTISFFKQLSQNFLFSNIFGITPYSVLLLIGILFSKYNIFESWSLVFDKYCKIETAVLAMITIILCVYVRYKIIEFDLDIIIVPIFLLAVLRLIDNFSFTSELLVFLGKNSTNMWLTHSFYCYYFYPFVKIVYSSGSALIAFVILVALSLITSFLIDLFWKYVSKVYHQIHLFLLNNGY